MIAPDTIAYPPRGLSREEAARYIGVGTTLFDRLVAERRMPRPIRVGKRVIWDRFKVDDAFTQLGESTENAIDRALGFAGADDDDRWSRLARQRGDALDRGIDPDTGAPMKRGARKSSTKS